MLSIHTKEPHCCICWPTLSQSQVPPLASSLRQLLDEAAARVCSTLYTSSTDQIMQATHLPSNSVGAMPAENLSNDLSSSSSVEGADTQHSADLSTTQSGSSTTDSSTHAPPDLDSPISMHRPLSPFSPAASGPQHAAATLGCRLGMMRQQHNTHAEDAQQHTLTAEGAQQHSSHAEQSQHILSLVQASLDARHGPPALLRVSGMHCLLLCMPNTFMMHSILHFKRLSFVLG